MNSGIVFPENVSSIPLRRKPLRLSHILAVVYCFGGAAGVSYLISKFIVKPLFEELIFERRLLAEETRERLVSLSASLSKLVSGAPALKTKQSDYMERRVQASNKRDEVAESKTMGIAATKREQEFNADFAKFNQGLTGLEKRIKTLKLMDVRDISAITEEADELAKYARSIQFENVPSNIFAASVSKTSHGSGDSKNLAQTVIECKQEIRALKSSILSG